MKENRSILGQNDQNVEELLAQIADYENFLGNFSDELDEEELELVSAAAMKNHFEIFWRRMRDSLSGRGNENRG